MKITKVFSILLSLHVGVILLVMFQPSCQTAGVRQGASKTDQNASLVPEQSFNQAELPDEKAAQLRKPGGIPADEFAAPSRPRPGDLIVPRKSKPTPTPAESPRIIVPVEEGPVPMDLKPKDLAVYKIQKGDTLWGIARKNGISLSDLLQANPNMDKTGRLSIGQEVMIPAGNGYSPAQQAPRPSIQSNPTGGETYQIASGDTLSRIAKKHGIRLSSLLQANGLSLSSIIRPGQQLNIPQGNGDESIPVQQQPTIIVPPGSTTHAVQKGENLSRIASIYGITVAQIMEWNGLSNPGLIRVGQSLIVAQGTAVSPEAIIDSSPSVDLVPTDDGGSLQDFFNESPTVERPIIDVSE